MRWCHNVGRVPMLRGFAREIVDRELVMQIISFAVATDAGNRRGGEQLSPTGRDDERLPADGQLSLAGGPSGAELPGGRARP
jgi:hypothetical protein